MDMAMPNTTATITKKEAAFSLPSFFSSHISSLEGSSGSSSSSGKNSAEYISAFTPSTMEATKVTTPRMMGSPNRGYLSLTSFSSLSRMASWPSG